MTYSQFIRIKLRNPSGAKVFKSLIRQFFKRILAVSECLYPASIGIQLFENPSSKSLLFIFRQFGCFVKCGSQGIGHHRCRSLSVGAS